MEKIDERRALELLIDVVDAAGEDVVYQKIWVNGDFKCRYAVNERPSCLVGQALFRAGATVETLELFDRMDLPAKNMANMEGHVTARAARVFSAAQEAQDSGKTWGVALESARVVYNRMLEEQA